MVCPHIRLSGADQCLTPEFDNVDQAERLGGSASQSIRLSAGRYGASMDMLASSTLAYADQGVARAFETKVSTRS